MLRTYLQQTVEMHKRFRQTIPHGFAYWCMEDYVLQKGQEFASQPLTDDELDWLFRVIGHQRFAIKQCYYNSQMLLMSARFHEEPHELRYVEGYATGVIPVMHGWLTLNGKVVDLTMRLRKDFKRQSAIHQRRLQNRVLGEFPEDRCYYGVTFDTAHVAREMITTGLARTLIDDWENGWPLLKVA